MIIVDTSVWVESKNRKRPDILTKLTALLVSYSVIGHSLVQLELMLGDASDSRKQLLTKYSGLKWAHDFGSAYAERLIKKHELAGKGIGAVDVQLLSDAHNANLKLWTLDTNLHAVAKALGCAYEG